LSEDTDEEVETEDEIPSEEVKSDEAPVADENDADTVDQKSLNETKSVAIDAVLEQKQKELAEVEKKLAELKEKVRTTPVEMARVNAWVAKKAIEEKDVVTSFYNPKFMQ
jgi:endonuclease III-like uncharacterized protein